MLFVNFKTYQQGTGQRALDLVRLIEQISKETQIKIIPVLQATDIKEATQTSKLEIWTQSVDAAQEGPHTGSILPEAVKEDGAIGTFLNHSEKKIEDFDLLAKTVDRANEVGLKTLVFAANLEELEKVLALSPTYASYEPPELVGSQSMSVTEAKPEVVISAVELSKKAGTPLIIGAGIKSTADIKKSLEFGATGFAVASAIVKSEDPRQKLLELIEGYKQ